MKNKQMVHLGARKILHICDIVYLVSSDNYTVIHLRNKEKVMVSYHLGNLEKRLSNFAFFKRINKSQIVNMNFVNDLENGYLIFDKETFLISRRRKKEIVDYYMICIQIQSKGCICND